MVVEAGVGLVIGTVGVIGSQEAGVAEAGDFLIEEMIGLVEGEVAAMGIDGETSIVLLVDEVFSDNEENVQL